MAETAAKPLMHEVMRRAAANLVPLQACLELTYRCNIRCEHCYIPHRSGEGELSTDEWKRVIEQVTEAGCLFLLISGGEPFLRRDALEIYLHAKRNGLLVTLFTNGTMITPRIAEVLAEYPPFAVEVSVYGATRETYRSVTRVAGAYDQDPLGVVTAAPRPGNASAHQRPTQRGEYHAQGTNSTT